MASRLIVKNVPKRASEKELREHFAQHGLLTDLRIMRTPDGRSRGFAFVGYRTDDEAADAKKYFHRSFLQTSRLDVDLAKPRGDASLERPWSRYSAGSSAYQKAHPEAAAPPPPRADAKRRRVEESGTKTLQGAETDAAGGARGQPTTKPATTAAQAGLRRTVYLQIALLK